MHAKTSQLERVGGWHVIAALLERQSSRVRALYLSSGRDDARAHSILRLAQTAGIDVRRVDAKELDKLGAGLAHQGVLADIETLRPWSEEDLLEAVAAATEPPLLLALDGVQDPHNLGACLRSADACGALAVIVPRDRAAQLNATVRKVAAGAAETTPVVAVVNLVRFLNLLKKANVWIVGADAAAPKLAHEVDLTTGLVLVLGAEGAGLRHLTRLTCDLLVRLPQRGTVESLNVSVAAGMLLYEALRQRS